MIDPERRGPDLSSDQVVTCVVGILWNAKFVNHLPRNSSARLAALCQSGAGGADIIRQSRLRGRAYIDGFQT